ncbi:hypothetical protein C2E23DRAFT_737167 [Lenzites betulinus]|nr:hypothetical protein C2E23DRAFT_737167 [Lenzites betulinus]
MLSVFSKPDNAIKKVMYSVLLACHYQGETSCKVIDIRDIISVIGMFPLLVNHKEAQDPWAAELYTCQYFVVQKLSLDTVWISRGDADEEPNADGDGEE